MFGQFGNWALKKVIWLVVLLWPKTLLKNNITSPSHDSYSKVHTPKKVKLKWKTVIATRHGPLPTILESRPFKIPKVNSIYHEGITDPNHSLTPHNYLQITSHATLHHHCCHLLHQWTTKVTKLKSIEKLRIRSN